MSLASIFADDGSPLASVSFAPGAGSTLTVSRVHQGKGRLLGYYLGQGRRSVHVQRGILCVPGVLQTSWLGAERLWQIRMCDSRVEGHAGHAGKPAA